MVCPNRYSDMIRYYTKITLFIGITKELKDFPNVIVATIAGL